MATVYHRDQPGAPALAYPVGLNSIAQFNTFKTILKACLVDGYGTIPAAGWNLVGEGTNYLVLGNGTGHVCFTWDNNGLQTIYLAQTFLGVVNDVMQGDGLCSGVSASRAIPQRIDSYCLQYQTTASTWHMMADSKTFILVIASAQGSSNNEVTPDYVYNYTSATIYVGDDSEGNFIAVGGRNQAGGTGSGVSNYFSGSGKSGANFGFTSLVNPATGLLVGDGSISVELLGVSPAALVATDVQPATMTAAIPEVSLFGISWVGNGSPAGRLRGLAVPAQLIFSRSVSSAMQCMGNPLTRIREASLSADLNDGYTYLPRIVGGYSTFFLLTDNPGFW